MMVSTIINRAVMQGIPLMCGSTGEIITEKAGHLNLGIPGIMYVGAISGVAGSFMYENNLGGKPINPFLAILIPMLCCLVGASLMGLIYCFLTVTLRANQNVTGLALTTFGIGIGNFFGGSLIKLVNIDVPSIALSATSRVFKTALPYQSWANAMQAANAPKWLTSTVAWIGEVFLSYGFLAYLAVVIAIIAAFVLRRTRLGLHLRAIGESPATADADRIPVTSYKYGATIIGSAIAGLGGLYYVMDYANGVWSNNAFGDRGWLAIALVIFAVWKPNLGILGSILFGGLYIAPIFLSDIFKISVAGQELVKMLPYVVTIIVLIITSIMDKKENQPPKSLGLPYFREDR